MEVWEEGRRRISMLAESLFLRLLFAEWRCFLLLFFGFSVGVSWAVASSTLYPILVYGFLLVNRYALNCLAFFSLTPCFWAVDLWQRRFEGRLGGLGNNITGIIISALLGVLWLLFSSLWVVSHTCGDFFSLVVYHPTYSCEVHLFVARWGR